MKRNFIGDALSLIISKIFILALSLGGSVILARGLGPDGRGLLAFLLVYPGLLTPLLEGGIRQAATFYVGKNKDPIEYILGAVGLHFLVASVLGTIVCIGLLLHAGNMQVSEQLAIVSALTIPATLASSYIRGVFLGKNDVKRFNSLSWIEKVIFVVALLILQFMDKLNVDNAILVTLFSGMINSFFGIALLIKSGFPMPKVNASVFWGMLKIGAVYAVALFLITANYRLDIILLDKLSDNETIGQYNVAMRLAELLWEIPAAIGVVTFARSAGATDNQALSRQLVRAVRITLFLIMLAACVLALIGEDLIILLYGQRFIPAAEMLQYLLPGVVIMTAFKIINTDMAGRGKPAFSIYIMLPCLIANIALNVYLIPIMGGAGAAITSSITYTLAGLMMMITYRYMTGISLVDILIPRIEDSRMIIEKFKLKR